MGLVRSLAHIHTGVKVYSHWFVISVCWDGLLVDPDCILCRGHGFPAELFGHPLAPDCSVSDRIYTYICIQLSGPDFMPYMPKCQTATVMERISRRDCPPG